LKSLTQHVSKIRMLSEADELNLIRDYQQNGNKDARAKLIESHLWLIISCAKKIPLGKNFVDDLISEGVFGFMRAVDLFDAGMNRRLSVIATFHVKARMQDYALRNMSSVKPFNSRKQRRVFFHFKKLQGDGDRLLTAEERNALAVELGVDDNDIAFVTSRLSGGDVHLDRKIGDTEMLLSDTIADDAPLPDDRLIAKDESVTWTMHMRVALSTLPDREREILAARRLLDPPTSLNDLAEKFKVSKGRISQIETAAFEKLKNYIREASDFPLHRARG
jgi:RNA polymerase sigma-32 factor